LHFAQLAAAEASQQRLLRIAGAISPASAMRAFASALAGTDLAHRHHFENAAEAYRQRFTTLIDEWDERETRGVTSFERRYAGNEQWRAIPAWDYRAPGTAFALRHGAPDAALLAAWLVLAASALVLAARRLSP
jgi:ABC-2 type transport system permease protein